MSRSDRDPLVMSLLAAVAAAPADVPLRLHVVGVLLDRGRAAEALEHCSVVLRAQPTHAEALALLRRASAGLADEPARPAAPADPGLADFDWAAAEAQVSGGSAGDEPRDPADPA
jgi:hypothetical protein